MVTVSPEVGIIPLGHGALGVVELQVPFPAAVIFAALAGVAIDTVKPNARNVATMANNNRFICFLGSLHLSDSYLT